MKKFIAILIFSITTTFVFAQEKLVPFFDNQTIISIQSDVAKRNNWFIDYPNFRDARIFILPDSTYALEVFYIQNDTLFKDRKIITAQRKKVFTDSLLAIMPPVITPEAKINQEGRVPLLIGSSLVSLGYYGTAAALITSNHTSSSKWPFAAYMFTGAAGILTPYFLTKDKNITLAQASITFHGQSRGILHGYAIAYSIDEYMDETWAHSIGLTTSILEGVGTYQLAKKMNLTNGQASMYQMGIDAGLVGGLLISDFFKLYSKPTMSPVWGTVLGSSLVFGATSLYASTKFDYTTGDAVFLRSSMALGALLPLPFVQEYKPMTSKAYTISVFSGGITGALAGHYIIKDRDISLSQGMYITLGEITGALLGLGTGYLIMPTNSSNAPSYLLWGSSIGAVAGYSLMSLIVLNNTPKKSPISCDLNINPAGIFYAKKFNTNQDYRYSMPIVNCNFAF